MRPSDEMLIAYVDGELAAEDARLVEEEVSKRPDLRAFVERQKSLRRAVGAAFAPMMDEDVPQSLRNTVFEGHVSRRWRLREALRHVGKTRVTRRFLWWSGIPAAAALACGVLVGLAIAPRDILQVSAPTGRIAASGRLGAALDTQLASTQTGTEDIRIGLSFRAKDGRYCRTFENRGTTSSLAGLACRDDGQWSVVALQSAPPSGSSYRMAGGAPQSIRRAVQDMIAGEPLDASAERNARDRGWKHR